MWNFLRWMWFCALKHGAKCVNTASLAIGSLA
jgi:hypothetical protein